MSQVSKHILLILAFLLPCFVVGAQESNPSKFKFDFHGFVNPHFYADSRQVVGGREEMMLFYPKLSVSDTLSGADLGEGWNADMLGITARLWLGVQGPDLLGAHTKAFVEGDFTGSTNPSCNNLRLRHAYIDMVWEGGEGKPRMMSHRILMGQYWYPMVVQEIMPNTRPLNMGAPFHPYARYNQLRYVASYGNWEAIAVAMYQQDNMSQGFIDGTLSSSSHFQRRGFVPEMHLQLRYNGPRLLAGAAANMLTIQPRIYNSAPSYYVASGVDKKFTSFSYSAFAKVKMEGWTLSCQTLLNNSLYEGCSMGGYVEHVESSPSQTSYSYSSWHYNTLWADFGRSAGHWRPGIFVGYAWNTMVDTPMALGDSFIGRGADIEYLWRVQPRIGYHASDNFSIYAEAEYTWAQYMKKEVTATNYSFRHDDNGGVGNLRLMLSAEYRF